MSNKDNDGPAFPVTIPAGESYKGHAEFDGMTLRDWFAAKALNALIGDAPRGTAFGVSHMNTNMNYALASYAIADAMLEARKQ